MRRILLVDDSYTVRLYARSILSVLADVEIEEAQNGVEALEKSISRRFDLLLVDVNMPKMDGYTLLRELRKHSESWAVPAIMVTTEDKEADRRRAYAAGASFHLSKPFDAEFLRRSVLLLLGDGA
jgi:two-component system, chemotaxis family, chemotaxis protein CheY